MANQMEQMFEPMYLGDERFQRWPSPTRNAGLNLKFSLQILNNRDNTPFVITMPSDLYLHIKKIQRFCDATPDIDLANLSGDNFVDGNFPWPDFRDVKNPPISENQLDSIGYNIDLTDSELTGPILGPALGDEDFLVQKLDLELKRTAEEPFEDIPMGLYEHKFFDARRQSYDTAMRAGEGMQIPTWTHKGFDAPVDDEDITSLEIQEVRKALRDYDMTYRANYLNSAFRPEARSDPPPKSSAMTNWYRRGPVGRGPKPPPKVRQDVADRIAEDYRLLLQEVTPAKNYWDFEMTGVSTSDELGTDDMEDTLVRHIANSSPGSSEYITGADLRVVSTFTAEASGEGILQMPSMARDYSIKNLATPKYVIRKGASGDSDDGECAREEKQKATQRSTTRKAATPRAKKTNKITSSSASRPNLIRPGATPKAKPPKTAGRKSTTPKTATPKSALPKDIAAISDTLKSGTFHSSKAKTPAAGAIPNHRPGSKYPTPRKSASKESADGSCEPHDDDMYDV